MRSSGCTPAGSPSRSSGSRTTRCAPRPGTSAVGYLRQAGDKALSRSASREAADWFAQALDALGHMPTDSDRQRLGVDLRLDLRAALYALGEFEPMLERLREADELARKLDDPRRVAWVSIHIGEYWRQTGRFTAGARADRARPAAGETVGDPRGPARGASIPRAGLSRGRRLPARDSPHADRRRAPRGRREGRAVPARRRRARAPAFAPARSAG